MSDYTVTKLDEIEEVTDGRCPWRPVRHELDITAFGVNAFTGKQVGDRIINEHDEAGEHDLQEELYLVHQGREVRARRGALDAAAGTFVYVPPDVKRTAFAEEPRTTLVAVGGKPGAPYEPSGYELWMPLNELYQAGEYEQVIERGREAIEAHPSTRCRSTTSPAPRASPATRTTRSSISAARSSARSRSARSPGRTRTSTPSATSRAFQELVAER